MTDTQTGTLAVFLVAILIGLFVLSGKQKRAHEDKMRKLRAERKANLEKLKREQAKK